MKDGAAQEGKGSIQPAQEQDEEHRKDDVALILHDLVVKVGGQHRGDDAAAVQRRDGDEVKDRQVDVQQAHDGKDLRDGVGGGKADSQHGIQEEAPQLVQNQAEERENDIGGGAGQRGKDHALFDILEIPGCNRHRLGPAKPGKNHQDGAEHIQVRQGIEGKPAEIFGGGVAQLIAGPGVGAFVDGYGGDQHHGAHQIGEHGFLQHRVLLADRDTVILYYYITHTHKTQANKA